MSFKGLSAEALGKLLDTERAKGARELLLYLKMSCTKWDHDTYGEIDDTGTARGSTTHTVVFDDGVLVEMLELCNISTWGMHAIDALKVAAETADAGI